MVHGVGERALKAQGLHQDETGVGQVAEGDFEAVGLEFPEMGVVGELIDIATNFAELRQGLDETLFVEGRGAFAPRGRGVESRIADEGAAADARLCGFGGKGVRFLCREASG